MRTQREVDEMVRKFVEPSHGPSKFSGMTYEQGIRTALEWVLEDLETEELTEGIL